jgi:TRAP-type C4-dicarboxylate transport system permease small subunit
LKGSFDPIIIFLALPMFVTLMTLQILQPVIEPHIRIFKNQALMQMPHHHTNEMDNCEKNK